MRAPGAAIAGSGLRTSRLLGCLAGCFVGFLGGCRDRPLPPRVPTAAEAGSEQVVVNYAPSLLRVLPIAGGEAGGRYLILGSERPGLPARFRPLGVTERRPPAGLVARAGPLAFCQGHVIEAAEPTPGGTTATALTLRVYDRDAKVVVPQELPLGCPVRGRPLLQSDGTTLWALARCDGDALLLTLGGEAAPGPDGAPPRFSERARLVVRGGGEAELFLRSGEDTYVLGGQKVLRAGPSGPPVIGAVPPATGRESRDLVRAGELLLIVDSGRLIALGAAGLEPRYEQRFAPAGPVTRLRAVAAAPDRLIAVWTESRARPEGEPGPAPGAGADQAELLAVSLPLGAPVRERTLVRITLGSGPAASDHELVPVSASDGGGALLVRTHGSNSGPLVALLHLHL